jgi:hypothetical protein
MITLIEDAPLRHRQAGWTFASSLGSATFTLAPEMTAKAFLS